jgi:hypothetical protein
MAKPSCQMPAVGNDQSMFPTAGLHIIWGDLAVFRQVVSGCAACLFFGK